MASFEVDVSHEVAGQKKGAEISAHFAVAIQEWKNTLLHGSDPKDLEKYWNAHQKEMAEVSQRIQELDKLVDEKATARPLVNKLRTEMENANRPSYAAECRPGGRNGRCGQWPQGAVHGSGQCRVGL
jgi:methyl-accepting chemotaxis protein-1 (serine sensor receptor)